MILSQSTSNFKPLFEALANKTGKAYFDTLVITLSEITNMKYVFVGKLSQDFKEVTTLSLAKDGQIQENFSYELADTPCSIATSGQFCFVPKQVQKQFPKDKLLEEMKIESYLGFSLKDTSGNSVGILVFLGEEAQEKLVEEHREFFDILSILVASELSRFKNSLELKISNERFRNFFNLGLVGMAITSLDKGWLEFNPTLNEMFDYTPDEFKQKTWAELTYKDDLKKDVSLFEQVLAGEIDGYTLDKRFVKKNGDIFYATISANAVKNEEGKIEYFVALVHDITSRKLAEMNAINHAENLRVTLNSIGDAVITTDINGLITSMNPIAIQLTQWKLEDAIGLPLTKVFKIVNALSRSPVENPVDKVLQTGEIVGLANHTVLISKKGKEYQIADSGAPILNQNNQILGVVLVFRDVTEEYKVQDQLRHSQKMDAIGQLAGGIAHDFNNMLSGILMSTGLVKKYVSENKKASDYLNLISESAKHAANLTQKLLTFSRKQEFQTKSVDAHKILIDTISLLHNTVDKKINIKYELNASNAEILGDPSQLQSALLNLGINATHAMPNGGLLTFKTSNLDLSPEYCQSSTFEIYPGPFIKIEVEDTGTGISPAILPRIFEPFFTTKEHGKGTGLGLAAVYGSIQQHCGEIQVKSQLNLGTKFIILLPQAKQHMLDGNETYQVAKTGSGQILLVDDEEIIRVTGKDILKDLSYKVLVAKNGREGLEIYQQKHQEIDLVILDMIMPEMNGIDCLVEMKKINKNIKVIIASGFTKEDDIKKLREIGITSYLKKPFIGNDLGLMVNQTLN